MHNTKLHFIGITAEGKKSTNIFSKNAMYDYSKVISKFLCIQTTSISQPIKPITSFGTTSDQREYPSGNKYQ